jgi:hypothetical protein
MIMWSKYNIRRLQPSKGDNLILSSRRCTGLAALLNKRWFRSFHTTQTQASHISCRKDRRARKAPTEKVNWIRWSWRVWTSTAEKLIHEWTSAHKDPNVLHERNKCWADSMSAQPDMQKWTSGKIIPRATKFVP